MTIFLNYLKMLAPISQNDAQNQHYQHYMMIQQQTHAQQQQIHAIYNAQHQLHQGGRNNHVHGNEQLYHYHNQNYVHQNNVHHNRGGGYHLKNFKYGRNQDFNPENNLNHNNPLQQQGNIVHQYRHQHQGVLANLEKKVESNQTLTSVSNSQPELESILSKLPTKKCITKHPWYAHWSGTGPKISVGERESIAFGSAYEWKLKPKKFWKENVLPEEKDHNEISLMKKIVCQRHGTFTERKYQDGLIMSEYPKIEIIKNKKSFKNNDNISFMPSNEIDTEF